MGSAPSKLGQTHIVPWKWAHSRRVLGSVQGAGSTS